MNVCGGDFYCCVPEFCDFLEGRACSVVFSFYSNAVMPAVGVKV